MTAFTQEPLDILDMLLVQLTLISSARAVLAALIRHCHGDLGKIPQVGKPSYDVEPAEHILLQQTLE